MITQLSLFDTAKTNRKKRKKAVKSDKKISNRGLLRSKITAQKKTIAKLTKAIKTEKKKETVLKKKLTKVRKAAKPVSKRKRTK